MPSCSETSRRHCRAGRIRLLLMSVCRTYAYAWTIASHAQRLLNRSQLQTLNHFWPGLVVLHHDFTTGPGAHEQPALASCRRRLHTSIYTNFCNYNCDLIYMQAQRNAGGSINTTGQVSPAPSLSPALSISCRRMKCTSIATRKIKQRFPELDSVSTALQWFLTIFIGLTISEIRSARLSPGCALLQWALGPQRLMSRPCSCLSSGCPGWAVCPMGPAPNPGMGPGRFLAAQAVAPTHAETSAIA